MAKGSKFERQVCKKISLWWTKGERDDVFWRSQTSGARATRRTQKGLKTFGNYGDVAAVDPIGLPLLKVFAIELKRGRSHGCLGDLIDCPLRAVQQPFEAALAQAVRAHEESGSKGWMLITRRDGRIALVCIDNETACAFANQFLFAAPCVRVRLTINLGKERRLLSFVAMPLETFLKRVAPKDIAKLALP